MKYRAGSANKEVSNRVKFLAKLFLAEGIELGNRGRSATFLKVRNHFDANVDLTKLRKRASNEMRAGTE